MSPLYPRFSHCLLKMIKYRVSFFSAYPEATCPLFIADIILDHVGYSCKWTQNLPKYQGAR